jgi:hypothetical protein
MLAEE